MLTHTTYWNSQFEEQVFTKKNPSHKLFASILNTTFKFLHTLPLEEHELVIDGIFSFLRPVFNEQRLLTQVQLTHPLEVLKQRADRIIEVRFKEKNLRLTDIAQELGVSVRYLSEAYKHAGTTCSESLDAAQTPESKRHAPRRTLPRTEYQRDKFHDRLRLPFSFL